MGSVNEKAGVPCGQSTGAADLMPGAGEMQDKANVR
jgi:hypothetical protein